MDAKSILAEEVQSIVTVKCFFAHQSPMIGLGIPAVMVVMIRPMIPGFGISGMLRVSFRVTWVFPWPFMRFPRLRLPNAKYK